MVELQDIAKEIQFRKHGQHNTANELGKLSIMIVEAFSDGLEHISAGEYIMDDEVGITPVTIIIERALILMSTTGWSKPSLCEHQNWCVAYHPETRRHHSHE